MCGRDLKMVRTRCMRFVCFMVEQGSCAIHGTSAAQPACRMQRDATFSPAHALLCSLLARHNASFTLRLEHPCMPAGVCSY